ncbi:hypothetical protein ACQY0O_003732 [Thecaphora frezii]
MAIIKGTRYRDLEGGLVASPSGALVPPIPLLRRKKVYLFMLLLPLCFIALVYNGVIDSPFFSLGRDPEPWRPSRIVDPLDAPLADVNALVGKLPLVRPASDKAATSTSSSGSAPIQNALLDSLNLKGTEALSAFRDQLLAAAPDSAHDANAGDAHAEAIAAVNRFDNKDEALLLLFQALKQPDYLVPTDWKAIYIDRQETGGIFNILGGGAKNRFTQLLATVGLDPPALDAAKAAQPDALTLYRQSRANWVKAVRQQNPLIVFSKSYCPYSKKAKALLEQIGANATVYEVDLRRDAHTLQSMLAYLTGHTTFPTVLVGGRLVGGNDDLQALHRVNALKSILKNAGAL